MKRAEEATPIKKTKPGLNNFQSPVHHGRDNSGAATGRWHVVRRTTSQQKAV